MSATRTIAASTHGRYIVDVPTGDEPTIALVGCHGYAESAETQMDRLRSIPGAEAWVLVSVQGLHRFYRARTQEVVASWMTSQDRDLAIADNLAYVGAVVDEVVRERHSPVTLVFAGFSQGVAIAFRAACASPRRAAGVIALGGDVPPELGRSALGRLPAALLGRGARDEWYSNDTWGNDAARLRQAGVEVLTMALDAAHDWTPEFSAAAGSFLGGIA